LKTSPVLFFSEAPKSQINYAETRQLEGRFLEDLDRRETKRAWEIARGDWHDRRGDPIAYGRRLLPTSFGANIRLEDLESQQALVAELTQKLEAMLPGVRERLREQKLSKLPADAREAVRTPRDQRTNAQSELASQHEHTVVVPWDEVADEAPPHKRAEAKSLANALLRAELQVTAIEAERMKVNYEYWRTRGLAESEDETIEARRLTYEANKLVNDVEIFKAVPLYEEAWKIWRRVIDRHPRMAGESVSADELMEDINRYKDILAKQGQKVPQPFILQDVIDIAEGRVTFTPEDIADREQKARDRARSETSASKTDEAQEKRDDVKTTQDKEPAVNADDPAKDKVQSNGNAKKVDETTDGAEK
jgi:hypothetical protein